MKKPWIWLRVAAVFLFLFVLAHGAGMLAGAGKFRDAQERAVIEALENYRFDIFGTTRSHGDFYTGLNWFLTVSTLVLALLTWQLSSVSRREPRSARPMTVTLCLGAIAFTVLCCLYFFILPLALYAGAAIALAIAAWTA